MKLLLDDLTKADFEHGSRIMKKSSRRGEISEEDFYYLVASLAFLMKKSSFFEEDDIQQLDEAIRVVLGSQL